MASPRSEEPSFSVVIPLYNKAPHVAAAIASALSQSRPPLEVIVIDDGSTDGGLEIVRAIDHPALKILTRSIPGPGGYAARNLGIEHANGNWTAFLDADDLWQTDHLKDLASAIEACAEPVGCAFTSFDVVAGSNRRPYPLSSRLRPQVPLSLAPLLEAWLDTKLCPIWTGASAFRTSLLKEAGLFPEGRARRGGDKDMWLRAAARERAVFIDRPSAEFHQDTVNRVTRTATHVALPVIVGTISALRSQVSNDERTLLEQLSNMEVMLYARHSAGAGRPFDLAFFRALYPPSWREASKMALYLVASPFLGLRR